MRRQRGLTLIELLIALTLFGVIGALCWRATVHMVDGRAAIGDELSRWRDIGRALQRVESELSAVLPASDAFARGAADGPSKPLVFGTLGEGRGAMRSAFRVQDGRFDWLLWADGRRDQAPEVVPLLDGVQALRWRFLLDGQWGAQWPPAQAVEVALPQALALELELGDAGTITRVFALR